MKLYKNIQHSLLAIIAACSTGGMDSYQKGSDAGNDARECSQECVAPDMRSDLSQPPADAEIDYDFGTDTRPAPDLGADTSTNSAPLAFFDPALSRNIRRLEPKTLVALVSDAEEDFVECSFNYGDGTAESDYGPCTIEHTYSSLGEITATVRGRDSRGLEGERASARFEVYINIPPHAMIGCTEYDTSDGLCVYEARVNENFYIDGPSSFDEDGTIAGSFLEPMVDIFPTTRYDGPGSTRVGMQYGVPGYFRARYGVLDNEGAEGSVDLHVRVIE